MHWIQRYILTKLATSKTCRFSDLIPEGVDGNLFTYHLKGLINEKYVEKEDNNYKLTSNGKRFVGSLSLKKGRIEQFPRTVTMIFAEDKEGKILFYKWNRQPYLNHVSLPFNRVMYGDSIRKAAEETVLYKTNLKGELNFLGSVNILTKENENTAAHLVAFIYKLKLDSFDISADGLTGQPFWGKVEDFTGSDWIYGTKEIIEIIKTKKSPFFEELVITK